MENVKLMNMCKIIDKKNNKVLVQERGKSWKGIAFPGGKIEQGEGMTNSAIREINEETGLTVKNLKLCGVKDWYNSEKNQRTIVLLYETSDFSGTLINEMEEGKNYWADENELLKLELADNFDKVLKIYNENNLSEMMYNENTVDKWDLI